MDMCSTGLWSFAYDNSCISTICLPLLYYNHLRLHFALLMLYLLSVYNYTTDTVV